MRHGLFISNIDSYADPNVTIELARAGEAAGWEALIIWDHLGFVWGHPAADPWTVLAAVGASTSRLILGTSVTPLPRRRPHVLAHQLATLDGLTGGGRVVFGAGLGGLPREFAAFGEPEDARLRAEKLDEGLGVLRQLLSGRAGDAPGRPLHRRGRDRATGAYEPDSVLDRRQLEAGSPARGTLERLAPGHG